MLVYQRVSISKHGKLHRCREMSSVSFFSWDSHGNSCVWEISAGKLTMGIVRFCCGKPWKYGFFQLRIYVGSNWSSRQNPPQLAMFDNTEGYLRGSSSNDYHIGIPEKKHRKVNFLWSDLVFARCKNCRCDLRWCHPNEFMTGCNRQWRVKKIQLVFSRRSCCHVFFSAPVDHCRRATPSTIPASIFEPVAIFDQLVLYGETFFWKGTHCHFGRFKNFFWDHIWPGQNLDTKDYQGLWLRSIKCPRRAIFFELNLWWFLL